MYPYGQTRDALMGAAGLANKRPPAVRIPAMRALGHYGDPAAADVLADALNEKADPKEVRLASAEALSEIYRRSGAPPTEKVFTVLRETLNDGDLDIELAAAHALGNVKLSLEQRRELEKFKRIKRGS
jgi:HEAT repeat protein